MLLFASSARALLRAGAPVGRLMRRVASTAEDLEPVKVTIDPRLRDVVVGHLDQLVMLDATTVQPSDRHSASVFLQTRGSPCG